jgi:hypothetical protein
MKKIFAFSLIAIFFLSITNISSFAQDSNSITKEDIKVIQNDASVPRKVLIQSKDILQEVNSENDIAQDLFNFNSKDITKPIIATRNLSMIILVLLIVIQIIFTLLGKLTIQELMVNTLRAVVMNFVVVLGLYLIMTISNLMGVFYNSLGKDFATESINSLYRFVTIDINSIPENLTKVNGGKLEAIDYSAVTLSPEGFCLNTIQDQYRFGLLIVNWAYVIAVYLNWLIVVLSSLVLNMCMVFAPIIGILYVLGDKYQVITRYWSFVIQASITKIIFYLLFSLVLLISDNNQKNLTESGVNIEFGIFSIFLMIALFVGTILLKSLFKTDAGVSVITDQLNKLKNKIK